MQLLRRFSWECADDAFAELVHRHLGLVYSAALRQVQSPELAEEVSQSVFLDLVRNAAKLPPATILTAWLFQVARRTAIDVVRREKRRHIREKIAHQLSDMNSSTADWSEIEPLLDEAVESLEPDDRAAVLLRYFADKSLREVGEALGTSENAAQKRLARAMDRLGDFFRQRGVRVTSAALIATMSAHAVQAIPAGLGIAITTVAAQSVAATTITAAAATTTGILTMNAVKTTTIGIALIAAISTGIYQAYHASELKSELDQLKAQSPLSGQLDQLTRERDDALQRLAALQSDNGGAGSANSELMRLRDEVSRLRREAQNSTSVKSANAATEAAALSWLNRVTQLKSRLAQSPEANIPEIQLLTQEDWLAAVKQPNLESDEDYRKAFAALRNTAQGKVAAILQPALGRYLKANTGAFPAEVSELQAFMEPTPLDPALLGRYAVRPANDAPHVKMGGDWIIIQRAPIDLQFDQQIVIGPNGFGNSSYPQEGDMNDSDMKALAPALKAFADANDGKEPVDPTQVEPFINTPEAKAAYTKFLKAHPKSP